MDLYRLAHRISHRSDAQHRHKHRPHERMTASTHPGSPIGWPGFFMSA
ncbi:hypothetical protein DLM_1937 [Aquitalea magnusonii]|uniref:Uncharacterized protein n=1 Tax=Aquitalea magnusonii TaxID=332411 RepID=A0A3G9GFF2_9NEIS|nr:hypothetical protein DLM_1937 [Aquitalea magnusonii]